MKKDVKGNLRIDDKTLARLMATEQDIIEQEPETRALRAKSKKGLGRLMSTRKTKVIDKEIDTVQQEVANTLYANREHSQRVKAFFDSSEEAVKKRVAELAQESAPTKYPADVYHETEDIVKSITSTFTSEKDEASIVLFNSSSSMPQPNGLSVALALHKLGFATPNARAQLEENLIHNEGDVTKTSATISSGPYSLKVGYLDDGSDIRVTMNVFADQGTVPERQRTTSHGEAIDGSEPGLEGISEGRRSGPLPSADEQG